MSQRSRKPIMTTVDRKMSADGQMLESLLFKHDGHSVRVDLGRITDSNLHPEMPRQMIGITAFPHGRLDKQAALDLCEAIVDYYNDLETQTKEGQHERSGCHPEGD